RSIRSWFRVHRSGAPGGLPASVGGRCPALADKLPGAPDAKGHLTDAAHFPRSLRRGPGRRFLGTVQKNVQRSIPPLHLVLAGQLLEAVEVLLGDRVTRLLVRRVAVVDAAAQRPRLARGTQVA